MSDIFDIAIIGGGSAGYNGAAQAVALGLKTCVIDGADELGGLCILRGCMPSKTLIESANRFLTLRRAAEFGLRAESIGVRPDEIIARKRRLVGEFADYRRGQLEGGRFTLIRGDARFVDTETLEVVSGGEAGRKIRARTFLIASGSVQKPVTLPGLDEAGFITSDELLESTTLPRSVIVLGGGPVALEAAHYYEALGAKVTLIQRSPHLLSTMDSDVADVIADAFRKRGMEVFCGTKLVCTEQAGELKRIVLEHEGAERVVEADEILYALGRVPNIEPLAPEAAGITREGGKLNVQATQQTSQPHIFAAGDAAGPFEVVHIAIQQAEVAARNAARLLGKSGGALEETDYRLKLFAVFTQPELAAVGATERELSAAGVAFRTAKHPFDDHGKSLVHGETEGFVKLIAHAQTGEILGGAVAGPHASELIHEIVVAMQFRATAAQLAAIPHYHPTLSEIWTYPAAELAE
jgi:pyruvate/2-oxoglutarate dehydrogenase complex dihydrolipoamide dehydrogenase (E3) component